MRTYQILKCSSIIHQFVAFEDAHQFDADQVKAGVLPLLLPQRTLNRVFSGSFDLALRAAAGRSSLVLGLERLSRRFQHFEEWWLGVVAGGHDKSSEAGDKT
jgi:hypothetical protein